MKKLLLISSLIAFGSFMTVTSFASENNSIIIDPNIPKSYFDDLNENDKVLQLPDGGFLYGSASIEYEDGTIINLNSETDPNAVMVKTIKETLE